MKVLVTGVAGFIGSHLLEKLLSHKIDVVGLDNLSIGKISNINNYLNDPKFDFDVKGVIGIESKSGNYAVGEVDGNGNWQTILSNLDGINGFEVVASIKGKLGSGRYALSHAIALSTFGGKASKNKIKVSSSFYGSFLNKINFRWKGTMHNYELQIRTRRHYGIDTSTGEPYPIKFNVIKLYTE